MVKRPGLDWGGSGERVKASEPPCGICPWDVDADKHGRVRGGSIGQWFHCQRKDEHLMDLSECQVHLTRYLSPPLRGPERAFFCP